MKVLTEQRLSFSEILNIQAKITRLLSDLVESHIIAWPGQVVIHVIFGVSQEPTFKIRWGEHPEMLEKVPPAYFYHDGDWSLGVVGIVDRCVVDFIGKQTLGQLIELTKKAGKPGSSYIDAHGIFPGQVS